MDLSLKKIISTKRNITANKIIPLSLHQLRKQYKNLLENQHSKFLVSLDNVNCELGLYPILTGSNFTITPDRKFMFTILQYTGKSSTSYIDNPLSGASLNLLFRSDVKVYVVQTSLKNVDLIVIPIKAEDDFKAEYPVPALFIINGIPILFEINSPSIVKLLSRLIDNDERMGQEEFCKHLKLVTKSFVG